MITKRQELILQVIIKLFTSTNQPVGSKTLMTYLPIHVSSATIRNEMAALESAGLIEKTHLSSGRIPSELGYRYYLDNLVKPNIVSNDLNERILTDFNRPFHQIDEIVKESAKILSDLTSYTAFVAGPEINDVIITGFRIVELSEHQVMAILVTSDGTVRNQVYTVPRQISGNQIEMGVKIINDQLVGMSLKDISRMREDQWQDLLKQCDAQPLDFLDLFNDVFHKASEETYYINGQLNLLNNDSVGNFSNIKDLYHLLDQQDVLTQLLGQGNDNDKHDISVRLGSELPLEALKDYSLITAHYDVGKYGKGTIALLGPTNMPYSQVIGIVDYFRNQLSQKLIDYYGRFKT